MVPPPAKGFPPPCGASAFELGGWTGRFRTRMSLRIRILIPWSANEHDSDVDSVAC
ncbi:hypothetical protein AG1IA_07244 [Rhizoctonia solani AG-1 IA]|uniref:Uncharacterized protein n=1 Tax=Thanatephorus cucumeris (strain AG1-IA) TaxID=983506 RepID=L8WPM8_THACA|nr:hypothetical protein AG1IA_07244 [Rhizoctonia solani AG-1 IA]